MPSATASDVPCAKGTVWEEGRAADGRQMCKKVLKNKASGEPAPELDRHIGTDTQISRVSSPETHPPVGEMGLWQNNCVTHRGRTKDASLWE